MSSSSSEAVDKEHLYGDFRKGDRRQRKRQDMRDRLWIKAGYKALDLAPEDEDMGDVYADNRRIGLGPAAAVALAAVMAATGIGGAWVGQLWMKANQQPAAPAAAEDKDTDTKYDWGFEGVKDGN